MAHLPTNRGFDSFTGYLSGAQNYYSTDRWHDAAPLANVSTYTSTLYGSLAVDIVAQHPDGAPLFIYLAWQAVHSPYACGPDADVAGGGLPSCNTTAFEPAYPGVYVNMLAEADMWMGKLRATLEARGMWEATLLVYASDNGGVSWGGYDPQTHAHKDKGLSGINFPLRGEKHG